MRTLFTLILSLACLVGSVHGQTKISEYNPITEPITEPIADADSKTAFLSIFGDDNNGTVGNISLPYRTLSAALSGLESIADDNLQVTVTILDVASYGDATISAAVATNGLILNTTQSEVVTIDSALNYGNYAGTLLLDRVSLSHVMWDSNIGTSETLAGSIVAFSGIGGSIPFVTIGQITLNGLSGEHGSDGSSASGETVYGAPGSDGIEGNPNGQPGETVYAAGSSGSHGVSGGWGRTLTLNGPITVQSLYGSGGNGGNGGSGGNGNVAYGGAGGNGWNATGEGDIHGGDGGNGGDAYTHGGAGGNGGNGAPPPLAAPPSPVPPVTTGGTGEGGAGMANYGSNGNPGTHFNSSSSGGSGENGAAGAIIV